MPRRSLASGTWGGSRSGWGNWKYLNEPGGEHLFDLVTDPGEKSDLRTEKAEVFARLKSAFAAWNAQMLPKPSA